MSVMPSLLATACAVVRLSPVSMTMRMPVGPQARKRRRRRRLDRIGNGDDAGRLAVDRRRTSLSRRRAAASSACALKCGESGCRDRCSSFALPTATLRPPTVPVTPLPVIEAKSVTPREVKPRCFAATQRSRRRADARSSVRGWRQATAPSLRRNPRRARTATTRGLPSVSVPVLSTTSVSIFSKRSSASAFLISTPAVAPLPTPTMIDIGVASPSAQGRR